MNSWIKDAIKLSKKLIDKYSPDLLLTISTPVDSHHIGLHFKIKYNIPWVAYFSDPWPAVPYPYIKIKFFNYFKKRFLSNIITHSDKICVPNKYQIDFIEQKCNVRFKDKSVVIPHIGNSSNSSNNGVLGIITHLGHLTKERVSIPLLEAIREYCKNNNIDKPILQVVGKVCVQFKDLVRKLNIDGSIISKEYVGYNRANMIAAKSAILLAIEADMPSSPFLPSKFVDYASVRRPILAITPENSAIRDYIKSYGGGIAVNNNKNEIYNAIERLFEINDDKFINNHKLAQLFHPEKISNDYIKMFVSIIDK
jgi:hypothetical protein